MPMDDLLLVGSIVAFMVVCFVVGYMLCRYNMNEKLEELDNLKKERRELKRQILLAQHEGLMAETRAKREAILDDIEKSEKYDRMARELRIVKTRADVYKKGAKIR